MSSTHGKLQSVHCYHNTENRNLWIVTTAWKTTVCRLLPQHGELSPQHGRPQSTEYYHNTENCNFLVVTTTRRIAVCRLSPLHGKIQCVNCHHNKKNRSLSIVTTIGTTKQIPVITARTPAINRVSSQLSIGTTTRTPAVNHRFKITTQRTIISRLSPEVVDCHHNIIYCISIDCHHNTKNRSLWTVTTTRTPAVK